jgi:hypothetical protein
LQKALDEDLAAKLHQAEVTVAKALGTYVRPLVH